MMEEYAFLSYAIKYWLEHTAKRGSVRDADWHKFKRLALGNHGFSEDKPWGGNVSNQQLPYLAPFRWAADHGHESLMMAVGETEDSPDSTLIKYFKHEMVEPNVSPFLRAATNDHVDMIRYIDRWRTESLFDGTRSKGDRSAATDHDCRILSVAIKRQNAAMIDQLLRGCAVKIDDLAALDLFYEAITTGNERVIQTLLKRGFLDYAHISSDRTRTPLSDSIMKNQAGITKLLLMHGASTTGIQTPGGTYCSLLSLASSRGSVEMVKLLLEHRAIENPAPGPDAQEDPFLSAVLGEHWEILQLLLAEGALQLHVQISKNGGRTPLQAAAEGGHKEAVRMLLDKGADVNAAPAAINGITALQAAIQHGDASLVGILLEAGADVNAWAGEFTPLICAARKSDSKVLGWLLSRQADVNPGDPPVTALEAAVRSMNATNVKLLLDKGADVNPGRNKGLARHTPLQSAAQHGDTWITKELIKRGADVNAKQVEYKGRTALQWAAQGGHLEIVKLLVDQAADINAPPCKFHGLTALQAASMNGHRDVVAFLLEHGAVVEGEVSESHGMTALQAAARHGHVEIAERLLDAGADIDAPAAGYECYTPLHGAADNGHFELVRLLIARGVDTKMPKDEDGGLAALESAMRRRRLDVSIVLVAHKYLPDGLERKPARRIEEVNRDMAAREDKQRSRIEQSR